MTVKIAVIDGQGGGIGSVIVKALRKIMGSELEVWALGTNAIATAQMMKAGANKGATGENAITYGAGQATAVLGTVSIILADSFMGEMTSTMAAAVSRSGAIKLLLPLTQENVEVVGAPDEPLPHFVEMMIDKLQEAMKNV